MKNTLLAAIAVSLILVVVSIVTLFGPEEHASVGPPSLESTAGATGNAVPPATGLCLLKGTEFVGFRVTEPPIPVPGEPFVVGADKLATLGDYKGKGVVLNFWATWCAPCVREMPALSRLQTQLEKDGGGIVVLTLSRDLDGAPVVEEFFEKKQITNLPVLIDKKSRLGAKMKIYGLPATIFIDPDGMERGRVMGSVHWDSKAALDLVKACTARASG